MRNLTVSVLLLAACAGTGVSTAQKGLSGGMNLDGMDAARRVEENKARALKAPRSAGLAALQAQDYVVAEQRFAELLSFDPTTSDASYLMGLAQIGLKKWPEARLSFETAVKNEPGRPEPKARLGVAAIMVGDITSASAQRAELAVMASQCGACGDAKRISDNLAMIDKVLDAASPKPAAAG